MIFLLLYIIAATVNIFSENIGMRMPMYISKILLMPLLAAFLYSKTKEAEKYKFIYLALFFSWLGDIFLMFPRQDYDPSTAKYFFILGLVSFLIAHINYIISFIKDIHPNNKVSVLIEKPYLVIPFLLYLLLLMRFLFPHLDAMKLPVSVYGICIILMLIFAFNRKNIVNNKSFYYVLVGAVLFIISDSLIAINVFYQKMQWHRMVIMLTYTIAQALIIIGVLENKKISEV